MNKFLIATILLCVFYSCGIFVPSDDYNYQSGRSSPRTTNTSTIAPSKIRSEIVQDATALIGTTYRYGGVNPQSGMDCSGLMNYVYQNVGIMLNRTSREQAKDGRAIRKQDVKPGDLVFFSKSGRVFHVALVANYDGRQMEVIHSTSSKGVIRQEILGSSYWAPKIHSFRDVIDK